MKTITLDVHSGVSQMSVAAENGEIVFELPVPSNPTALRQVVEGVAGPKRIVMENGPLAAMIHDALHDLAVEIIAADPTRNALIARAEDSNDERDARRLGVLQRAGALYPVYVPPEPYRTLRSLVCYDLHLSQERTSVKNQLKALCRRHAIPCRGKEVYSQRMRAQVVRALPQAGLRWQMESLYRRLDYLRQERRAAQRTMHDFDKRLPVIKRLQTVPGIKGLTARTLVAWIVDPGRFKSRSAISSYAGLGLGQGVSNWKPVGRAHASKRGQRAVKRVLFTAARAALRTENAFAGRYQVRLAAGWEDRKAIRDVARTMLLVVCRMWHNGTEYCDELMPQKPQRTV
jgi:transposase